METTIIVSGIITGLMGAGATWILIKQEEYRATRQSAPPEKLRPSAVPSADSVKRELVDKIRQFIGQGEALKAAYFRDLGTAALSTRITHIEQWRTTVGNTLNAPPLHNSGATEYVLTLGGDRITEPLQRLREVLANLDTWIAQGSRSTETSRGPVARLVKMRAEGVALRNREVKNDEQWIGFHNDFLDWDRAVVMEMRSVGVREGDIGWFETLDLVPPITFAHAHNDLHAKDLRELSEKLKRLLEIIQRHDQS